MQTEPIRLERNKIYFISTLLVLSSVRPSRMVQTRKTRKCGGGQWKGATMTRALRNPIPSPNSSHYASVSILPNRLLSPAAPQRLTVRAFILGVTERIVLSLIILLGIATVGCLPGSAAAGGQHGTLQAIVFHSQLLGTLLPVVGLVLGVPFYHPMVRSDPHVLGMLKTYIGARIRRRQASHHSSGWMSRVVVMLCCTVMVHRPFLRLPEALNRAGIFLALAFSLVAGTNRFITRLPDGHIFVLYIQHTLHVGYSSCVACAGRKVCR